MTQTADSIPIAQRFALMRQCEQLLRRDPGHLEALTTLAVLLGAQGDYAGAVNALKRGLAKRKKEPQILRMLASACNDAGDLAQARKFARQLCEVEPGFAENHKVHGMILESCGQPARAATAFRKADAIEPDDPATLTDIGRCLGRMGEFGQALEQYERALKIDPNHAAALQMIAAAKRFSDEDANVFVERADAALQAPQSPRNEANLLYASAKALDDVGRYDAAFQRYARANAIRRPKQPADLEIVFRNITDAFDRPREPVVAGLSTSQPIFIIGMPRSGTTLVESLFASHPAVTAAGELAAMETIAKSLGRDAPKRGVFALAVADAGPGQYRALAEDYLARCKLFAGSTAHFTDKLPHNFLNVGLINLLFPNARIIHCRRHPLDTCFSIFANSMREFHNGYKTELDRLGGYWRQYDALMAHWRALLPGRMHEVFYEDLVANTEFNARAMVDHLGLKWIDSIVERGEAQHSVRTLSGWQVRQPVYQSSKGRWRRYEKHLEPLIEAIGEAAAAYEAELRALE